MRTIRLTAAVVALALSGIAAAQGLPDYYPEEGFQRTALVDTLYTEAQRIVIGDLSYTYSPNVVVHSPRSYSVPVSSLKPGTRVGFKTLENRGRVITEIWVLPDNYDDGTDRR